MCWSFRNTPCESSVINFYRRFVLHSLRILSPCARGTPLLLFLNLISTPLAGFLMLVLLYLRSSSGPRLLPFHGHSLDVRAPPQTQQLVTFSSLLILSPRSTKKLFPNFGISILFSSCFLNFAYKPPRGVGSGVGCCISFLCLLFIVKSCTRSHSFFQSWI